MQRRQFLMGSGAVALASPLPGLANTQNIQGQLFESVSEMKQANLGIGDSVTTSGYYNTMDFGGANYQIISPNGQAIDQGEYHQLSNGLIAQLLPQDKVSAVCFGVTPTHFEGTSAIDNQRAFSHFIQYCIKHQCDGSVPNSTSSDNLGKAVTEYIISAPLAVFGEQATISRELELDFCGSKLTLTGQSTHILNIGLPISLKNLSLKTQTVNTNQFAFIQLQGGATEFTTRLCNIQGEFSSPQHSGLSTYLVSSQSQDSKLELDTLAINGQGSTGGLLHGQGSYRELKVVQLQAENFAASPNEAVVRLQASGQVILRNIEASRCGQLLNIEKTNQLTFNALNLTAFDSHSGENTQTLAGVKIDQASLQTDIHIDNLYLLSQAYTASTNNLSLSKGLWVYSSNGSAHANITVDNATIGYCKEGVLLDTYTQDVYFSRILIHHNQYNGVTLRGLNHRLIKSKVCANNQIQVIEDGAVNADGYHGHGVAIQGQALNLEDCIFGEKGLATGGESQISAIFVSANEASATLQNCLFANYKEGYKDVAKKSSVSSPQLSLDINCKSWHRSLSSFVPVAPQAVKAKASINEQGNAIQTMNCSYKMLDQGVRILFTPPMLDTDYQILASASRGNRVKLANKQTTSIDLYPYDDDGKLTAAIDVVILGNSSTQIHALSEIN